MVTFPWKAGLALASSLPVSKCVDSLKTVVLWVMGCRRGIVRAGLERLWSDLGSTGLWKGVLDRSGVSQIGEVHLEEICILGMLWGGG